MSLGDNIQVIHVDLMDNWTLLTLKLQYTKSPNDSYVILNIILILCNQIYLYFAFLINVANATREQFHGKLDFFQMISNYTMTTITICSRKLHGISLNLSTIYCPLARFYQAVNLLCFMYAGSIFIASLRCWSSCGFRLCLDGCRDAEVWES